MKPVLLVIAGQLRKIYGPLPQWIADAVDALPRHPEFADLRLHLG